MLRDGAGDPIRFEIVRNALVAVTEEMALAGGFGGRAISTASRSTRRREP